MPTGTTRGRFWGPMYPDAWATAGRTFWGGMYPDPGPDADLVTPVGPSGVATFYLSLDSQFEVQFDWMTDIFKAYAGREKRTSLLDRPKRRFKGDAFLVDDTPRAVRAQLARYSSAGSAFMLGLPFEGITLTQDASGASVFVNSVAADWVNPGQRVLVVALDGTTVEAVIQSATSATTPDRIDLNVAPGATGAAGGTIMPLIAIYLDPQQGFSRYPNPTGPERWALNGLTMLFGFQASALRSSLDLAAAAVGGGGGSGSLAGASVRAKVAGAAGNLLNVRFIGTAPPGGEIVIVVDSTDVEFYFAPGSTTVATMISEFQNNAVVEFYGSPSSVAVLGASDAFGPTALAGGTDLAYAEEGVGATVATHAGRPVWDRGVRVDGAVTDSLQAMNEIIDLGGVPTNLRQADVPDWGRAVDINRPLAEHWQWFKKFMVTVRGRQKAFWLPTYRADLSPISSGVGTLTIEGVSDATGAFFTWYPYMRNAIQIAQADGTITRATITDAVDNGDGTVTLTTGVTLSGSAITMVSWLELCRFERDSFTVLFKGHNFGMATLARVVQQ
jgi:hypothetical protein